MKSMAFWRILMLTCALPACAWDLPPNIMIEWQAEAYNALPHEINERQFERYLGAAASGQNREKNQKISSLRISIDGKNVPIEGWMYMDLANPQADTKYIYGNADIIMIQFRIGTGAANGFLVDYRIAKGSLGYRVMQRDVCFAENRIDGCIRTINNSWPVFE